MRLSNGDICTGSNGDCPHHFHVEDLMLAQQDKNLNELQAQDIRERNISSKGPLSDATLSHDESTETAEKRQGVVAQERKPDDHGFRRIVRNFTPSWFIITMSTGVVSILLHQLPYNGHWLEVVSIIFFVLNLALFLLFTFITCLRYILYPYIFPAVLRHPHQSLFLATFPVGLATLINMVILVCVPAWGHGIAIFAWVLWWIDSVMALVACFHLTYNIMSNRRSELAEMTALYLIPIVAVVIAATSGGLVAGAIPNTQHQLWTLIISYIFWGIGSPLSWIILTIYFLRLTIHEPLKREVIVSLLLPIGPLALSGFSIIALGKLAKRLFPLVHAIPHVATAVHAGDIFYVVGLLLGVILWGFAIVWFVIAVVMIATSGGFPFNMGWWGFIFPVGVFDLLTITIGEELESKFFKILSCVLAMACVIMWLVIAVRTVRRSLTGKMFFAPCLGTDLFLRQRALVNEDKTKMAKKGSRKDVKESV